MPRATAHYPQVSRYPKKGLRPLFFFVGPLTSWTYSEYVNPEETDQFRTFESRVEKLTKDPKKEVDDLEKEEASRTAPSNKSSDDAPEDDSEG